MQPPIGILGGTFDPIHLGHLRAALELQQALKLTTIHFLPCFQPVHRHPPIASSEKRLQMIRLAIQNEPSFRLDTTEIDRQGPSYAFDTLAQLRQKFPDTPLCWILGIDAFLQFHTWHRYEELFSLAHFIIAHRPHYHVPTEGIVAELLKQRKTDSLKLLHQQLSGSLFLQPITLLDISASEIRKQIKNGENPRFLVPDSVYDYVMTQSIYR